MIKNTNNTCTTKKTFNLNFWIPFILIMLLFCMALYLNENTAIGWILFVIVFIIMFSAKIIVVKTKFIAITGIWILVILLLCAILKLTSPIPVNLPVVTSTKITNTNLVKTENGLLKGVYNSDKSVKAFAGVPYAAPPVGNLRWKAPKPAKSWSGVRAADHFSDCEIQSKVPTFIKKYFKFSLGTSVLDNLVGTRNDEKMSEDCLYLNIWSPAKANLKNCPVIVYIHGGSFKFGSGSINVYNGEQMAKKGVIFVTLNYRMGVFGFMSNTELTKESGYNASGNYGLLDQVAALKWVKNNISQFGGNPNNVTLAGESAGSMCVNALVASPLAKNLFQRAISESGANFGSRGITSGPMLTLSEAEKKGEEFEKHLKKTSLSDLRKMSAADLLKASKNYTQYARPIVDSYLLPDTIYNIFAEGRQNDVPVIIGSNADEGTAFLTLPKPFSTAVSAKKFKEQVKSTYKDKANEFLKIYPASTDSQAVRSQVNSGTYQWFGWHMHTWAKLQNQMGKSKVYYYYFDRVAPGSSNLKKYLGAFHGSEIPYAYGNLSKLDLPFNAADRKLSNTMFSYWVNFATTGNPNGKGLPNWTPYDEKKDEVMELGDNIRIIPTPHKDALKFFDSFEANLRSK